MQTPCSSIQKHFRPHQSVPTMSDEDVDPDLGAAAAKQPRLETDSSDEESDASEEADAAVAAAAAETIDVTFEFFDPKEQDYHGIRNLLSSKGTPFAPDQFSSIANLIVLQPEVSPAGAHSHAPMATPTYTHALALRLAPSSSPSIPTMCMASRLHSTSGSTRYRTPPRPSSLSSPPSSAACTGGGSVSVGVPYTTTLLAPVASTPTHHCRTRTWPKVCWRMCARAAPKKWPPP